MPMNVVHYNIVDEHDIRLKDLIEDSVEPLLIIRLSKNFKDATCLYFTSEIIDLSFDDQENSLGRKELEVLAVRKAAEHFDVELKKTNFLIFVINNL